MSEDNNILSLQWDNSQLLKSILANVQGQDLKITCKEGESVYTSTILLAMGSSLMRTIFSHTLERTLRVEDEMVSLCLPDFKKEAVKGLLSCLKVGVYNCTNQQQLDELQDLLETLQMQNFSSSSSEEEVSVLVDPTVGFACDSDDDDDFFEGQRRKTVNILSRKKRKLADLPNYDDYTFENLSEECIDTYLIIEEPVEEPAKRPRKASLSSRKLGKLPQKQAKEHKCPNCDFTVESYESAIRHIESIVNDEAFKIPAPKISLSTGEAKCPLCLKNLFRMEFLKFHLGTHMKDAHMKTTHCENCNVDYETT